MAVSGGSKSELDGTMEYIEYDTRCIDCIDCINWFRSDRLVMKYFKFSTAVTNYSVYTLSLIQKDST